MITVVKHWTALLNSGHWLISCCRCNGDDHEPTWVQNTTAEARSSSTGKMHRHFTRRRQLAHCKCMHHDVYMTIAELCESRKKTFAARWKCIAIMRWVGRLTLLLELGYIWKRRHPFTITEFKHWPIGLLQICRPILCLVLAWGLVFLGSTGLYCRFDEFQWLVNFTQWNKVNIYSMFTCKNTLMVLFLCCSSQKHSANLATLCREKGATEEELVVCKPRRRSKHRLFILNFIFFYIVLVLLVSINATTSVWPKHVDIYLFSATNSKI